MYMNDPLTSNQRLRLEALAQAVVLVINIGGNASSSNVLKIAKEYAEFIKNGTAPNEGTGH